MIDATGMPQNVVVIGATSDLAHSLLVALATRRLRSVVLAGRRPAELAELAAELRSLGVAEVETVLLDVRVIEELQPFVERVAASLDSVDLVVVATGVLGTAALDELDAESVAEIVEANFTGPAVLLSAFARVLRDQGFGRMLVYASVAGVRVRAANFAYGGAKAGLDGFCQGLDDVLAGSGASITIVRPGFVHSKMTRGRTPPPLAVDPEVVTNAVLQGLEHASPVVWAPATLRYVFAIFRVLPRALWRKIPG